MEEILDDFTDFKSPKPAYSWNYLRWWYYIIGSIIINTLYLTIIPPRGDFATEFSDNLFGIALVTLIGGFILGGFLALFPFKDLSYKDKYLHSSQWSMLLILMLLTLGYTLMWLTDSLV